MSQVFLPSAQGGQVPLDTIIRNDSHRLTTAGYDDFDDMLKVKSVQKKWRDSFSGASLDVNKWDSSIGAGGSLSQASSVLNILSGTTINSETSVLSKETFTVPFRLSIGLTLSQRIINQTFYVEVISVDPTTGIPDGKHSAGLLFDGTSATQAKYSVQNGGLAALVSSAQTVPSTASGSMYEIELFADEAWFHGGILDSTNARSNSYRRHQQIPDPNSVYKVRLRWVNGGTAPASTSTAAIQYISVQDYAELTAEITAGRGQSVAGQAVGVQVAGNVTLGASSSIVGDVAVQVRATGTSFLISRLLSAAATTNASSVKASSGKVFKVRGYNASTGLRYLKFYNKASSPTVGTDTPVITLALKPSEVFDFDISDVGHVFSTGIAYAITTGVADADTGALTAADILALNIFYL